MFWVDLDLCKFAFIFAIWNLIDWLIVSEMRESDILEAALHK
jgi:hypothetical protein